MFTQARPWPVLSQLIQSKSAVTISQINNLYLLNIYSVLIKSSLLYGSETWRLTENNKRRVEATEMDALGRSSRISRKERIGNVTIRQQIRLEETIVKEIEQNQLTWYGHVQRMAEGRLPKIALKWMPKRKRARGRPKKKPGWKV